MSNNESNPWQVKNSDKSIVNDINSGNRDTAVVAVEKNFSLTFEDNFISRADCKGTVIESQYDGSESQVTHKPLPDSENYLKLLERKLDRVKKGAKLIDSLTEKRQDCMRALLADSEVLQYNANNNNQIELDTPIQSSELQRHILPVQALTVGETVHIVNHDYLEQQAVDSEEQIKESN